MTMIARTILSTLLLLLPLQSVLADVPLTHEGAINKAGLQRMLSQRIVASYCMIGLDILPKESRQSIDESVALFEQQLDELKGYSIDEVYQEALEWVTIAWERYRPLVTSKVEQGQLRRINHLSEDLLYTTHKVVLILQDLENRPVGQLVNVSGRQRMLSQRIAKLYLMRSWGVTSLTLESELQRAVLEFDEAIEQLRTTPKATDAIRTNIDKALVQWNWFKSVINRPGADPSYRLIVADASDSLYRMMDEITHQFEKSAAR